MIYYRYTLIRRVFKFYFKLTRINSVTNITTEIESKEYLQDLNLRGFGPLANYADRATAASWRSSTNFCG
jgi:hypothetical protein